MIFQSDKNAYILLRLSLTYLSDISEFDEVQLITIKTSFNTTGMQIYVT